MSLPACITLRTVKGSVLSWGELDNNFVCLNNSINSLASVIGNGNRWHIPSGTTLTIETDYQHFIYGDMLIEGVLQLSGGSQLVVLNGNVIVSGGTIVGPGTIYDIQLPDFDTKISGITYTGNVLTIYQNDGSNFNVTINSSTPFTGNTSGECITDLYVTNVYGCSPITVHDSIQSIGSSATGLTSFAFGDSVSAFGDYSHAEGIFSTASGSYSHAEGVNTVAGGGYSHAEGYSTVTGDAFPGYIPEIEGVGVGAHSEGGATKAYGNFSHSEGVSTTSNGVASHAEGQYTTSSGGGSHAEGDSTISNGSFSHAEGLGTYTGVLTGSTNLVDPLPGYASHSEGLNTFAYGPYSHSEGLLTKSIGEYSHAEGYLSLAHGNGSHSEGSLGLVFSGNSYSRIIQSGVNTGTNTITVLDGTLFNSGDIVLYPYNVSGNNNLVHTTTVISVSGNDIIVDSTEPINPSVFWGLDNLSPPNTTGALFNLSNVSPNLFAHAEGSFTLAGNINAHAEGRKSVAIGEHSHAEGVSNIAQGKGSHAEGYFTSSFGEHSHSEGDDTTTNGFASHSEGSSTTTNGVGSHAEGVYSTASGNGSHAEGYNTTTSGYASHSEGIGTIAIGDYSHVSGQYNLTATTQSAFIIGNGLTNSNRSNLLFAAGNEVNISGKTKTTNFQMTSGATAGYVLTSDTSGNGRWLLPSTFTGNTSGNCITNLYVSNLNSCSPLHIQPINNGDVYISESGGNVGIGTTSPTALLHLKSTSGTGLKYDGSVNNIFYTQNDTVVSSYYGYWINGLIALAQDPLGSGNLFVGYTTLALNKSSNSANTIIGNYAANNSANTSLNNSVIIGAGAGSYNNSNNNVIIGKSAASIDVSGSENVIIGGLAASTLNGGSYNTFLGSRTDVNNSGITNSILIGYGATSYASNELIIGDYSVGNISNAYVGGGKYSHPNLNAGGGITPFSLAMTSVKPTIDNTDKSASNGVFYIDGARGTGTGIGGDIVFRTSTSGVSSNNQNSLVESMRIVQNGNIGIGTTTPSETLEVNGKTKTTNFQMTSGGTTDYILTSSDSQGNGVWTPSYNLSTKDYGSFFDTTTQTGGTSTTQAFQFNSTATTKNISITNLTGITITHTGVYNLQFSAQLYENIGSPSNVFIWLRKNGTDVPNSNGRVVVGNNNTYVIAAWNYVDEFNSGDVINLMWFSDSDEVSIFYEPTPVAGPAIPSVILTITQI